MHRALQPATALAFVFIGLAQAPLWAFASMPAVASAVPAAATPSSFLQLLQVVVALVFVLALIVGAAFLMRRFQLVPGSGGANRMRVVSGVMVGPKERVVIVELDGTWLVVGVTPQNVSLLHTTPRPADAPVAQPVSMPFAGKLAELINKNKRHPS